EIARVASTGTSPASALWRGFACSGRPLIARSRAWLRPPIGRNLMTRRPLVSLTDRATAATPARGAARPVLPRVVGWLLVVLLLGGLGALAGADQPARASAAAASQTCPCSLWDAAATPGVAADPDAGAYELGVKFQADVAGYITGVRFYKGEQ